jgi:gliding motility-associated-like protein
MHWYTDRTNQMKKLSLTLLVAANAAIGNLQAQQEPLLFESKEYERAKAAGELDGRRNMRMKGDIPASAGRVERTPQYTPPSGWAKGGGGAAACDLWQVIDACTDSVIASDDFPSTFVQLPFDFNLYGTTYNGIYVNNNGNVSFGAAYPTYSGSPFPNPDFVMVAPFWADVDTRPGADGEPHGEVRICINDLETRVVITWDSVGYFAFHGDKRNTFQLILTNGFDPLLGLGNNVAFVYQDMQWTTGDASDGDDGFGGFPAVVGGNLGDGTSYIQIGTFDHPGVDYDGPLGVADGVDWLDFKTFVFSTLSVEQNIPPLASGTVLCDTVEVCANSAFTFDVEFYSPEPNQSTEITLSSPTLGNLIIDQNNPGNTANIQATITPNNSDVGFHTISVSGTDNGTPSPATTNVIFVLRVLESPVDVPVISGDADFCAGGLTVLSAAGDYQNLEWSTGAVGSSSTVFLAGTYTVTGQNPGECPAVSEPFVVTVQPSPTPVITGDQFSCGGTPAELSTVEPYTTYAWSNGANTPTNEVLTGTYFVTVMDANGCSGTSDLFPVQIANDPIAFFTTDPNSPQLPGITVNFTDGSTIDGSSITSWDWDFDYDDESSSDPNPSFTYTVPGTYQITLVVTTADGCQDSTTVQYLVAPQDVIIPNVFTPNNDNVNDVLEFANVQYYRNELTVYNRWGQKVFEANNYQNTWRAADQPDGTYFYTLLLTDSAKEYKGHVTLLR